MRFAAYAGTSMVLATGVIVRALHERANFYSACVYLAQSNACLMVLTNVALLSVGAGMLGLQRLFYGALRPIEVEQLYEKAWFAITETCLAMTIFREEVGGWFLVMFVCLLIGKVWGWIGEGRVEVLEQQPPSNPRLFHARLSLSLIISTLFDIFMLRYSIKTVLRHARPNMMVMFAFEFAVLAVTSISTAARYVISLYEIKVIKAQTKDRRAQLRMERALARSQSQTSAVNSPPSEAVAAVASNEDDIDSLDIDVPGWEEKGRWVFYLDLTTDFFKLVLYLTFFCVLCMFYGMPIHIIRDVALTIRSFYKRITDFVRYRQATRDMNARYPDATAEEVAREDVCIICREDMRPWQQQPGPLERTADNEATNTNSTPAVDDRFRPKKLPCGHILHFACLRSWLERQQNCPTCRRPVLVRAAVPRTQEPNLANQHGRTHNHHNHVQAQNPPHRNLQQPFVAQNVFNLGPLRIAFGARHGVQGPPQLANNDPPPANPGGPIPAPAHVPRIANALDVQRQAAGLHNRAVASFSPVNLQLQLLQIEQQLVLEINRLRVQQNELHLVRALQGELARLRAAQTGSDMLSSGVSAIANQPRFVEALPSTPRFGQGLGPGGAQQQAMGYGHPNLPVGMTLPLGWTVLPLQRLPDQVNATSENHGAGTSNAPAPAQTVRPSDGSLPNDAVSTISSQSTSTVIREDSATPSAGVNRSESPGQQTRRQPFQSSLAVGEGLSRQFSDTGYRQGEIPQSTRHTQQVDSKGTPSDKRPKSEILDRGSCDEKSEPNQQQLSTVGSSRHVESAEDNAASSYEETLAQSRQIKGKGKASTVEDFTEDLD